MVFSFFFNKRGQFAVEYLLVTGFLFMLLVPSLYILYNYTITSQEQLALARANEVGNAIIANAEKVYYYGKGSKLTISIAMPPLVEHFSYRCHETKPCEIFFKIQENELGFTTAVPLASTSSDCKGNTPPTNTPTNCEFGKTQEDKERFRAAGPKTITLLHTPEDTVSITIE